MATQVCQPPIKILPAETRRPTCFPEHHHYLGPFATVGPESFEILKKEKGWIDTWRFNLTLHDIPTTIFSYTQKQS
jgi:hypothetical protein